MINNKLQTKLSSKKATSNSLLKGMKKSTNYTQTENGALTHKSTQSNVLDFFALGGSFRTRDDKEVIDIFNKAFSEDPNLAMKCLFYIRDVRGGLGERRTFRIILNDAIDNVQGFENLIPLIPEYGRWDDLFELIGTRYESNMWQVLKEQFQEDIEAKKPTLLGKWLKSENTSSRISKEIAILTMKNFNLTPRLYRKHLTQLRKNINVLERQLSTKSWHKIEYDKIPSKAGMIYRKAFFRHDEKRYKEFITAVTIGEKKINTSTLYPYEIFQKVDESSPSVDMTLQVQWDNLPDYTGGDNAIVMADTSGSMGSNNSLPICIATSLAAYFAQRNKGAFHNHFITFENRPQLLQIGDGMSLATIKRTILDKRMVENTNIQAAFDLILDNAVRNRVSQKDMPTTLFIISDMEFDQGCLNNNKTNFQVMQQKYKEAGYKMPIIVFWNVNARNNQVPVTQDERGVYLVSGASPSTFKQVLVNRAYDPQDFMMKVLGSERYTPIRL